VLEAVKEEADMRVVVKHPEQCTACGDCLRICRFGALELVERTGRL
jgi:NAD-dependent dihydropyrimidine dehydrogenase PreA subunit